MPPDENQNSGGGGDAAGGAPTSFTLEQIGSTPVLDFITDAQLKADPSLATFKGVEGLARSYAATKKLVGGDASEFFKIPTDKTTPEERDKFWNTLGRPETADKYQVPKTVVDQQEALMISNETLAEFGKTAHQLGLSNSQFAAVTEWYAGFVKSSSDALEAQVTTARGTAETALKTQWGGAYDEKVALAKDALKELSRDDPTLVDFMETSGLGNDPRMLRMFERLGRSMKEDLLRDGKGGQPGAAFGQQLTPEQATAEHNRLMGDTEFYKKWIDKNHPGHDDAIKQVSRLMEQRYPKPSAR